MVHLALPIRARRLLAALVLGLGLATGWLAWAATPAYAASDEIDRFSIRYTLQPSGVLDVTEEITYRFGDDSGRHGIDRYFVTRERYDDTNDAVYGIRVLDVSSPDPVGTQYSESTFETDDGRGEQLRLRIGDPDRTIRSATATYVIRYQVSGAMRSFPGYDELYWDATGSDWRAVMREVEVEARVPGGAQDVTCFFGRPSSRAACDQALAGPTARFSHTGIAPGEGMTIGVQVRSGLVADNKPHLEPDGSKLSPSERVAVGSAAGLGALLTVGSPIVGFLWWRKNGRDLRYAGQAPGSVPLPGQSAAVTYHDPDIAIPVAFTPPTIPVAEAGLLIDGQVDTRETAATIIDLAVRGAVTVQSEGDDDFRVTLVDPNRATAPHEMVLLSSLFGGRPPGATVDLSTPGSLLSAHRAMQASVRNQVAARGWFRKIPSASAAGGVGFGAIALIVFAAFTFGMGLLLLLAALLPVLITVLVVRWKLRRGQRTPDGRAVCDQVEGFRTYLATAEADQIRFEEGEDIFSRYLPWAIVFELADRWAKVCADLVAMGRLPDVTPYWYVGYYHLGAFNTGFLTSTLATAAAPAPSTGASGTGFGGGSSFGGGGFSGGGGGGGGGGSW